MRKVIIDCDPGIDDTLALSLAVKSPDIEVVAITVVCGNVPADIGTQNVLKCLERCDRLDIPVYQGMEKPLKQPFISAQDTHGMDGLGETNFPMILRKQAEPLHAVDFLADYFKEKTNTSVIALGPLTNIAFALKVNPNIGKHMDRFVSMGGTYKSHGNCSPVAEYNYWCDPEAASYVFENLKQTIEMVGLDVTREIVLTPTILEYCCQMNPEEGEYLKAITRFYFDFHWKQDLILSVPGTIVSSIITVQLFGGITSSGSSMIVQLLHGLGLSQTTSVILVQAGTDYLDRLLSIVVVSLVITMLPQRLIYSKRKIG